MIPIPNTPMPEHPPVVLILNGEQAYALLDAITCLGLAVDGELAAIRETYAPQHGPDFGAANFYQQHVARTAYEVHAQIEGQQAEHVKEVGRWMRSINE